MTYFPGDSHRKLIAKVFKTAGCLDFMQRKLHDQPVSSKNYCPLENTPGVLLHGFV